MNGRNNFPKLHNAMWPGLVGKGPDSEPADMAHTLLYTLGYNAPEARILPADFDWKQREVLDAALKKLTDALRPRTIDFHVAQNDARAWALMTRPAVTVSSTIPTASSTSCASPGIGCATPAPSRPARFVTSAGTAACPPNSVMRQPQTWNDVLKAMVEVRDAHGWRQ